MLNRILYLSFSMVLLAGCDVSLGGSPEPETKEMVYSYSCIDSAVAGRELNKTIGKAGDLIRDFAIDEKEVSDEVQNQYGEMFHKDALDTKMFTLLEDAALQQQLNGILTELLEVRKNPSKIKYLIYPLKDTVVNAFTFGGRIYITEAMLNKTKGRPALLYAIIGHEIGHSEKGHIRKTIQEMLLSEKIFGESGMTVFQIKRMLTGSFNQKNELEADYYGTDLTYALKQDVCAAVVFWKEMSALENKYNQLEDFFRSHPFSALRAECLENHIKQNFESSCFK